jgi:hypothetical protein
MKDKLILTIIFISFNSSEEILICIDSLKKLQLNFNYKILVIENGDISNWESSRDKYSYLTVINPKSNIGFSKANNLAVSQSSTNYILFLNPDTLITEDFITPILSFYESEYNLGACGPALFNNTEKIQNSVGFRMGFMFELLESFYLIKFIRKLEYKFKFKYKNKPVRVTWISAACLIIEKEKFEQIGGFDEDYFLNYEDIDMCQNLENAGYKNYYFPYLKCIHIGLTSQGKDYESLIVNRYKSRLIFARKHYGVIVRFSVRIIHLIGLLMRIMVLLIYHSDEVHNQRFSGYKKVLFMYLKEKI